MAWDETWTFTISYSGVVKADLVNASVKEYTSGRIYPVTNGGSVTVSEERISVIVTVKNIGTTQGYLRGVLYLDGVSKGEKTTSKPVAPGGLSTLSWDLEVTPGDHTIRVQVGH